MEKEVIQRVFTPGSEWVYYKIYCGINTADSLLVNALAPMSAQLIKDGVIDKWFFIRYGDPDKHLRVRFHLQDQNDIGKVLREVHKRIASYFTDNLIWNIQLDTYHRELERYGSQTMEDLELYFYHDSEAVIQIVNESSTEEVLFSNTYAYVDAMINSFFSDPEEKLAFLDKMQLSYKNEFRIDNARKKRLGKKYRNFKDGVDNFKNLKNEIDMTPFEPLVLKIRELEKKNELEMPLHSLASSLVHMTVNRVFQSRQRLYEMVLYDFLYQKNRSDFYRSKKR